MSDSDVSTISLDDLDWLHYFFWCRGLSHRKPQIKPVEEDRKGKIKVTDLDMAVRMTLVLAGKDTSHETIRRAAMSVFQMFNELQGRRKWLEGVARQLAISEADAEEVVATVISQAFQSPQAYRTFGYWEQVAEDVPTETKKKISMIDPSSGLRKGETSEKELMKKRWLRLALRRRSIDLQRKSHPTLSLDAPLPGGQTLGALIADASPLIEIFVSEASARDYTLQKIFEFFEKIREDPTAFRLHDYDVQIAWARWIADEKIEAIAKNQHRSTSTVHVAENRVRKCFLEWFALQEALKKKKDA